MSPIPRNSIRIPWTVYLFEVLFGSEADIEYGAFSGGLQRGANRPPKADGRKGTQQRGCWAVRIKRRVRQLTGHLLRIIALPVQIALEERPWIQHEIHSKDHMG